MAKDVNQRFYDFLLKRQHYVYYYENGLIKELIEPFKAARADIIASINKLQDVGSGFTLQYRLDRLNAQLHEIDFVLNNATDTAIGNLSASLNEFAQLEADTYYDMLQSRFNTIGISLTRLPLEQVYEIVSTPLGGVQYADRMKKNYGDLIFDMKAQLTQSILQGEDMATAARRLYNNAGVTWGDKSKIIARTEIQRVSNNVSYGVYKENIDVLKGVEYVATLDDRTCIACGALDGRIYYFSKGDDPVGSDRPPLHPYCRCTLSPLTYSWKELGDKAAKEPGPSTRASFSGQVPATEKYNDWLKRMDQENPAFVQKILGMGRPGRPGRYQLWNHGNGITLKEMAKGNRVLSLKQLDNLVKRINKQISKDFYATPISYVNSKKLSSNFKTTTKSLLDAIPKKIKDNLNNNGVKINIGDRLTSIKPELKGVQPRGWPKGLTWDNVAGGYRKSTKEINIAQQVKIKWTETWKNKSFDETIRSGSHEIGHAVDFSGKSVLSQDPKFVKVYDDAVDKLSKFDQKRNSYFLQPGGRGREEAFAEAFGREVTGALNRDPFFIPLREYMRDEIL